MDYEKKHKDMMLTKQNLKKTLYYKSLKRNNYRL